jgi:hypothetical protein
LAIIAAERNSVDPEQTDEEFATAENNNEQRQTADMDGYEVV